jgi:hypothetical protein
VYGCRQRQASLGRRVIEWSNRLDSGIFNDCEEI